MWETAAILKLVSVIVSGIFAPLLVWYIKEHFKEKGDSGETQTEKSPQQYRNEKVEEEIERIRKEIQADRIWIAQFHNGGRYIGSVDRASMKKMSIKHEATARGVSREEDKITNVLVSFFSEMVANIISEDYVKYVGGAMDVDPEVELLFRQRGTSVMHIFSMKDIDDVLIGIMGIDYKSEDQKLSEEEIQYLNVKASLLAGYLYYANKNNT